MVQRKPLSTYMCTSVETRQLDCRNYIESQLWLEGTAATGSVGMEYRDRVWSGRVYGDYYRDPLPPSLLRQMYIDGPYQNLVATVFLFTLVPDG